MSESKKDAIDISDFVYAATGARVRRLTMPDGEYWFPAVDVCRELGHSNPRKALADHVYSGGYETLDSVTSRYAISVPAGRDWRRHMKLVNLQGLLMLVNGSTKPETEPFKRWVTEVVIAVQRDGSYSLEKSAAQPTAPTAPPAYAVPQQVADAIVRLEERNLRIDEELITSQRDANRARWEAVSALNEVAQAQRESVVALNDIAAAQRASVTALHAIAEAQRASVMTLQEALAQNTQTMTRVADTLDRIADRLPPQRAGAARGGMTAERLLAAWRERLTVTDDVWAVAVLLAPALVNDGEARLSIETIAARTGLTTARVHDSLRFLLRRQCIRQTHTTDGTPAYTLHHA